MTKDGQRIKNVSFSGSFKWQEIKKLQLLWKKGKKQVLSVISSKLKSVKDIFSQWSDDLYWMITVIKFSNVLELESILCSFGCSSVEKF